MVVAAAAQLQGCSILLTEDLQDGALFDGLTVRSPFTLDVREPRAACSVAPVVASRHRPRGRNRLSGAGPGGEEFRGRLPVLPPYRRCLCQAGSVRSG